MKFSLVPVLALVAALPALALPEPVAAPVEFEKRDVSGVVTGDGVRYRNCPRTSCTAMGQYSRGTHISIQCYTDDNTSVISGNP